MKIRCWTRRFKLRLKSLIYWSYSPICEWRYYDGTGKVLQQSYKVLFLDIFFLTFMIEWGYTSCTDSFHQAKKLIGKRSCLGCNEVYSQKDTINHKDCLTSKELYDNWYNNFKVKYNQHT